MLTVSCANQKLDDPTIADVIVRVAPTTPLDTLNLRNNSITFVPKGLAQYTRLVDLVVSFNAITKINLDDLNLAAPVVNLDLSFNTITAIANSSLPGKKNKAEFIRGIWFKFVILYNFSVSYAADATVKLDHNNLTELSEGVFRPVIQFFIDNGLDTSRISVASSENAIAFIFKSRIIFQF